MKMTTQQLYTLYLAALATAYSVTPEAIAKSFTVVPTMEQKLIDAITASDAFLGKINNLLVNDKTGEAIFGQMTGPITSRTNTDSTDRTPSELHSLTAVDYNCQPTEVNVAIKYATIDAWAKFPDFQQRLQGWVLKQMALDKIMVGWNGTSIAAATNLGSNPLLQDLNKGWVQKMREGLSENVFDHGGTTGKICVGDFTGADFKNLDGLVHGVLQLIDPRFRAGGDLVAIIGLDLLANDKAKLYDAQGSRPMEKERIELAQVTATYGGLPAYSVPNFPLRGVAITSFDNLSIYTQETSQRRQVIDYPKRNRIEQFYSRNEDYVVEVLEKMAVIEAGNVKFNDGSGADGWTV
jgi:P2 family phage major capsid protein